MMRLICGTVAAAAIVALLLATPYLRQKLFVTDNSAAMALSQLDSSDRGDQIVDCINLETRANRLWSKNNAAELTAYHNRGGPWDENNHLISGLIGWHVTWVVAIPLQTRPVVAYDMNGVGIGTMWSREVPSKVVVALQRCGVKWAGLWAQKWPQTTPSIDDLLPRRNHG